MDPEAHAQRSRAATWLPLDRPDGRFEQVARRANELRAWLVDNVLCRIAERDSKWTRDELVLRDVRATFLNQIEQMQPGLTLVRAVLTSSLADYSRWSEVWEGVGLRSPSSLARHELENIAGTAQAIVAWGVLFNWVPMYEVSVRTLAGAIGIANYKARDEKDVGVGVVLAKLLGQTNLRQVQHPTGRTWYGEIDRHMRLVSLIRGTVHNYGLHRPFRPASSAADSVEWNGREWSFRIGESVPVSVDDGVQIMHGAVENWGALIKSRRFARHLEEIPALTVSEDNPVLEGRAD